MTNTEVAVPAALMRGGTSKGLYFVAGDLPTDTAARDRFLLAAMGSPDVREIDGVCLVRREDAAVVLEKAREREANEAGKRTRLASGELGLDIYDMRDKLAAKGLVYEDYQA